MTFAIIYPEISLYFSIYFHVFFIDFSRDVSRIPCFFSRLMAMASLPRLPRDLSAPPPRPGRAGHTVGALENPLFSDVCMNDIVYIILWMFMVDI